MVNEHTVKDNLIIKPLDLSMQIMASIDVGEIMMGPYVAWSEAFYLTMALLC